MAGGVLCSTEKEAAWSGLNAGSMWTLALDQLQGLVPGDCSFVLEAVTSGRLSLQAAGVETTTAEVTMTIYKLYLRSPVPAGCGQPRAIPTTGEAWVKSVYHICFSMFVLFLSVLLQVNTDRVGRDQKQQQKCVSLSSPWPPTKRHFSRCWAFPLAHKRNTSGHKLKTYWIFQTQITLKLTQVNRCKHTLVS